MAKYEVTVIMEFPDDIHGEDIINIAEQRLGQKVHRIEQVRTNRKKEGEIDVQSS